MPKVKDMTTSEAGLVATCFREGGIRNKAYDDKIGRRNGKPDPGAKGIWTYGIGFAWKEDEDGARVPVEEGDYISDEDALKLLREEMDSHEEGIRIALGPDFELTQYQFDALADHCFQFGTLSLAGSLKRDPQTGAFTGERTGSGIARALLRGEPWKLGEEFARWRKSAGRISPGVYNRSMSRLCQFNALPFKEVCYSGENLIEVSRDGRTVVDRVSPEITLARARAYLAQQGAPAGKVGVPAPPASSPSIEETPTDPEPIEEIQEEPLPEVTPPAGGKPLAKETKKIEEVPLPNVKPENGAKPMTESERFWQSVWIGIATVVQAMIRRGAIPIVPSWAVVLLSDVVVDPYLIGGLVSVTLLGIGGFIAAGIALKRATKKLAVAVASASQVTY